MENNKDKVVINHSETSESWFDTKIKPILQNRNSLFYYVLILIVFGFAFYAVVLLSNGFAITPSGDYVVQDIAFYYNGYDDWHKFYSTGIFPFWDPNTFLGADNIASNAFYYVFNPFFILCTFFPRSWLVQMMSLSMILKMVLAAVFFRLLLKKYGVKEWTSRFFSICYGFGGWIIFYMWFNCFMDICTFFPLILLGIEKVLKKEKPFVLVFGICLIGLSNFYFLVPVCIGSVLYALFRWVQKWKTRTITDNVVVLLVGIMAFTLGLMLCGFVILPAFKNALTYNRTGNSYLGLIKTSIDAGDWGNVWSLVFDWNSYYSTASQGTLPGSIRGYRAFYPLISFLFPPCDGRNVSIMNVYGWGNRYDEVASSLFGYTPTIIIFFASIFKSIKDKKWSHLIAIAFFVFALFTPFFYYFFLAFTSSYGRWELIPYTFLILYAAVMFNDRKNYKGWYFDASFLITLALMSFCIYYVYSAPEVYPSYIKEPEYRWLIMAYEVIMVIACYIIIRRQYDKRNLMKYGQILLFVECAVMGVSYYYGHSYTNYFSNNFIGGVENFAKETEFIKYLNDENSKYYDDDFYRIQSGRVIDSGINIGMLENYNGTSYFHSTYNSNQDQYLAWARISRSAFNWCGESIQKKPFQDTFLGVKYYLTKNVETNYGVGDGNVYHIQPNIPFGYKFKYKYEDYSLYENTNFIELGFSYDKVQDPKVTNIETNIINSANYYNNFGRNELDNDYNFLNSLVLSTDDISMLKENYKEEFQDKTFEEIDYQNIPNLVRYGPGSNFSSTLYHYDEGYYFDPTNPHGYLEHASSEDQNRYITYGKDIVVLKPNGGTFTPEGEKNAALFIDKYISKEFKYGYFLITKDSETGEYKTVTYDNSYLYSNGGSYRYNRSLYTQDNDICEIICVPYYNEKDQKTKTNIIPSNIFRLQYSDYMNVIDGLNAYPLESQTHATNHYGFTTNYVNKRLICLNVGYSSGWKVTAIKPNGTKANIPTMKGNGGWVSFVSEEGNTSYSVDFVSPYFKVGFIASSVSILSLMFLGVYYYNKKLNKSMANDPKYRIATIDFVKDALQEELKKRNKK